MADIEKIVNNMQKLEEEQQKLNELEQEEEELDQTADIADSAVYDHFAEEYNILKEIDDSIDTLYDQIKEQYDAMLNSRQRGGLNFIQGQTSNLISLKTTKLNVVKERINLKKNIIDYGTKRAAMRDTDNTDNAAIEALANKLIGMERSGTMPKVIEETGDVVGTPLEEVVAQLESTGDIKYTDTEKTMRSHIDSNQIIKDYIKESMGQDNSGENQASNTFMAKDFESFVGDYFDEDDIASEEVESEKLEEKEELIIDPTEEFNEELPELPELPTDESDTVAIYVLSSKDRQTCKYIAVNELTGEILENHEVPELEGQVIFQRIGGELFASTEIGFFKVKFM